MSEAPPPETAASRAATEAARDAYGRLVAYLAGRTGDLAMAEDALADAFVAALERWPTGGVPERPEAWLLTVAKRRGVDQRRRGQTAAKHLPDLELIAEEAAVDTTPLPDRRLPLLFTCAHPSIDPAVRAPLMLQTVLGLNAKQIGQAFLVPPTTMGQRLSRVKRKIKSAKIPFGVLDPGVIAQRLPVVCEAIYAAFATGYDEQSPSLRHGLASEAIWLGRLVHRQSQGHAETAGLLSLMLHVEARRPARRDDDRRYIPFERQDPARWDRAALREAAALLESAARQGRPGRFQLEAAIQSAHVARQLSGRDNWADVVALYDRLLEHADTLGARVARCAALAEVDRAELAYAALLELPPSRCERHQAYWALRAHLERDTGRDAEASVERAAALSEDPAVREYLRGR